MIVLENFEWFEERICGLSNENERRNILLEIKLALSSLNSDQLKFLACKVDINIIFDCLNSSDREQINNACDVVSIMLSPLEPRHACTSYEAPMRRALLHPVPQVVVMVLKQLHTLFADETAVKQMDNIEELVTCVVLCSGHEELFVAKNAVQTLITVSRSPTGLALLFTRNVLHCLRDAMRKNDIVRFRIYEHISVKVVVSVAGSSEQGLIACHASGLLPELFHEVLGKNKDGLGQLSAMELLSKLVAHRHGFRYLQERNVLSSLATLMLNQEDALTSSIILPGMVKFFGNAVQSWPKEMFRLHQPVVAALFEMLDTVDLTLLVIVVETVGYIASTSEGKRSLNSVDSKMLQAVKILGEKIMSLPFEFKVRALNTLANLIEIKSEDETQELSDICFKWFKSLAADPVELVMYACRQPFPELRLAALQVLKALVSHLWGLKYLKMCPGLMEYLMDRSSESDKLCIHAKFDVVQAIVQSPFAEGMLEEETLERLKRFEREGAFFVLAHTEVAVERDT